MIEAIGLPRSVGSMFILQTVKLGGDYPSRPKIIGCFRNEDTVNAWMMEQYPQAKHDNERNAIYARCYQSQLGFILTESDLFSL